MREARILYFALGVLLVVSVGAVSLHETGIGFPDGSFQTTAGGFTAATAVQNKVDVIAYGGGSFCTSSATLYSVPAGKRLVIEWLAAESRIFGGTPASHPANVNIWVHNGSAPVRHPLPRLVDPLVVGESFSLSARWMAQVRLYSEASNPVEVYMCFNDWFEFAEPVGSVWFSGYLIDV